MLIVNRTDSYEILFKTLVHKRKIHFIPRTQTKKVVEGKKTFLREKNLLDGYIDNPRHSENG